MPTYATLTDNMVNIKKTIFMQDVSGNEIEVVDEEYQQPLQEIVSHVKRLEDESDRISLAKEKYCEILDAIDMSHLV